MRISDWSSDVCSSDLLGLYTMARPSAILELTWDRVDFERRLIDLNPAGRKQTAKRRPVVKMNDELFEAMQESYTARPITHDVEHGGKPVANITTAFQAARDRRGVDVTPYMIRHSGADWAAEAEINMAASRKLSG